jgi:membrane-associated phospholipid phosphatase
MMEQRIDLVNTELPSSKNLLRQIQRWDERVIRAVATSRPRARNHPLNLLMRGLTRFGDWDVWTSTLLTLVVLGGGYREAAFRAAIPLILTFLTSQLLKRLVRRPRPSVKMPDLARLLGNPDEFSFPSSHTASAWAICLGLGYQLPGLLLPGILLAAGIGWSRIHVGAHYLSDIIVGACLGIGITTLVSAWF